MIKRMELPCYKYWCYFDNSYDIVTADSHAHIWKPFSKNNCHMTQIASMCGPAPRSHNRGKPCPTNFSQAKATTIVEWPVFQQYLTPLVSESVDCSCRDGADTLIVRVYIQKLS